MSVRFYSMGFIFGVGVTMSGLILGTGWAVAVTAAGFVLCGLFGD